jgi:hypothetical protein
MRFLAVTLLFASLACAQAPVTPAPEPAAPAASTAPVAPATPAAPAKTYKIDPGYITAVQAISNQFQEAMKAMQTAASASVAKLEGAQCKEGKIKRADCAVDWKNGVYFYAKPTTPPGTASPAK